MRRNVNDTLNRKHYDRDLPEHAILAADWMDDLGEHFMPGLPNHPTNINPTNVLINGKGVKIDVSIFFEFCDLSGKAGEIFR